MSDISWLTAVFCPLLGVIISNARAMAPVNALIRARRDKKLGPLSPIPFALITNNCMGWTIYAVLNGDYYIFTSNCFSMILGLGLCLTAVHILEHTDHKANPRDKVLRLRVETILMCSSSFWLTIIFIVGIVLHSPKYSSLNILIVGSFSCICSLVFYAAPLTNITDIIKKKDSSSLYAPAIAVNLICCVLWFFYGLLGVKQMIVWIPNGVGAALCIFELIICCIYPPITDVGFDGQIKEDYSASDFAVYASSRHMSSADLIPLLGTYFVSGDGSPLPSASSRLSGKAKMHGNLHSIPEDSVRSRAATTTEIESRENFPRALRGSLSLKE